MTFLLRMLISFRRFRAVAGAVTLAATLIAVSVVPVVGASAESEAGEAAGVTAEFCRENHSSPAGDFITHPVDADGDGIKDLCVLDNYFGSDPGVGSALKRLREARELEYNVILRNILIGHSSSSVESDPRPVPEQPPGGLSAAFCQRWHSSPAGDFVSHPVDTDGDGAADVCVLDNYFGSDPGVGSALKQLRDNYPHQYRCHLTLILTQQPGDCGSAGSDAEVKASIAAAMTAVAEFQRAASLATGKIWADRWEARAEGYAAFDVQDPELLDAVIDVVVLEAVERNIRTYSPVGISYSTTPLFQKENDARETLLRALGVTKLYANERAWDQYVDDFNHTGFSTNRAAQKALAAVGYAFYFQIDQLILDYDGRIVSSIEWAFDEVLTDKSGASLGGRLDTVTAVAAYGASKYVAESYSGFEELTEVLDERLEALVEALAQRHSASSGTTLTAEENLLRAEAYAAVAEAFDEAGIELFDDDPRVAFDGADIAKLDAAILAARVKLLHKVDADVLSAALTRQMESLAEVHQALAGNSRAWAKARVDFAATLDAFSAALTA